MSIYKREKKMKGFLKTAAGLFAAGIISAFIVSDVSASTGIYIGKDASAEGTTVIGVTLEAGVGEANVCEIVEKGAMKKGDVIESQSGYEYTLPEENARMIVGRNMAYVGTDGYNNSAVNEYGVSIVCYITTDPNMDAVIADPFVDDGICEDKIPTILAATSKSAADAVKTLCSIYEETGADAAEIIMIADQKEAWIVENYTGHQYVATKLADDVMATFGNEPVIRTADPDDKDTICSSKLFTLPEENGFAVYDKDKKLDLILTYNDGNMYSEESHLRGWVGHDLFAPSEELDFDDEEGYDVFFKPDKKVRIAEAFDFFRNRYEGTPYDLADDDNALYYGINNQYVSGASVIQIFDDVPAEMSTVFWTAPANPTATPFIAIPFLADNLPEEIGTDVEEERFDDDILQFEYARLNNKIILHRHAYGDSVREYVKGIESFGAKDVDKKVRGEWKEEFAKSPEGAAATVDAYVADVTYEADDDAKRLTEDLEWYLYRTGIKKTTVPDDEIEPFECSFDAVSMAEANGWEIEVNDDFFIATKDDKSIQVELSGENEGVVVLEGFDNDQILEDFMETGRFEFTETDKTGEVEEAEEAEEAEDAEEAEEPEDKEVKEESAKDEVGAENPAETDDAVIEEIASDATKQIEVDTIAELSAYFAEKTAAIPRDGWAEADIANQLAGISNDVTGIIGKYFSGADIEDLIGFDAGKLASDKDIEKVGNKVAEAGLDLSALVQTYFTSLTRDVSEDIVNGRLSQEGAIKILNEAEGNIEGIARLYLDGVRGAFSEMFSEIFNTDLSDEELKETIAELGDGALDLMEEYGAIDRESLGMGDLRLSDLTDADIDVVITLNEMDDDVINGLSDVLGVDVRSTLDKYIDQINASNKKTKVVEEKHEMEKAQSAPDPMVLAAIDEYAPDDDYVVPQEIIDILNEAIAEAQAASGGSEEGEAVVEALSDVLEETLDKTEVAEEKSETTDEKADYDDVITVNVGKIAKGDGKVMLPAYLLKYFR